MSAALLGAAAIALRVLGPGGAPEAGAQVVCAGDVAAAVGTDATGRARVPADCGAALCTKGDLAGVTDVAKRTCRLAPAALVTVAPVPPGCAPPAGCRAALTRSGAETPLAFAAASSGDARWRFPALPPGAYTLEVARPFDGWVCAGTVDLAPGRAALAPEWREPRPLHGRVLGPDGAPRFAVPVTVSARGGTSAWTCAPRPATTASDANGNFRVLVDPARTAVVTAAGVSVERDGAATEETLFLDVP